MKVSQRISCSALLLAVLLSMTALSSLSAATYLQQDAIKGSCYFLTPVSGLWEKVLAGSTFTVPAGEPLQFRFGDESTPGQELSDLDAWLDPYYLADVLFCRMWFDVPDTDPAYATETAAPTLWDLGTSYIPGSEALWDDKYITKQDGLAVGTHVVRWKIADGAIYSGYHRSGADDSDLTASATFVADATPPDSVTVYDDGDATSSTTSLHAAWTASDPQSGIVKYAYSVVNSANGTVVDWTTANPLTATDVNIPINPSLAEGETYYCHVKAYNGAGQYTEGVSDGIVVDTVAPGISIGTPSVASTRGGPVSYTITYNGANSITLDTADVTLTKTGSADGTVAVTGSGTTSRTVQITGITGDGTLRISIAAGTASDSAGNTALGAGPSGTFAVDNTPPIVTIGTPSSTLVNSSTSVSYVVTYSPGSTITLTAASVTLNKTGTANGTVYVWNNTSTSKIVAIRNATGDGQLSISIAAGTATDAAGNLALAAGPSQGFTADNTPPTVTIATPRFDHTGCAQVIVDVIYTGASDIYLDQSDISWEESGDPNYVWTVFNGSCGLGVGLYYSSGSGQIRFSVAAGTARDAAGNYAPAAGPSTWMTMPPQ